MPALLVNSGSWCYMVASRTLRRSSLLGAVVCPAVRSACGADYHEVEALYRPLQVIRVSARSEGGSSEHGQVLTQSSFKLVHRRFQRTFVQVAYSNGYVRAIDLTWRNVDHEFAGVVSKLLANI